MKIKEKPAKSGDKMIEVRVRFWTVGIAKTAGNIRPKHAWDTGTVVMDTNESHGIKQHGPIPFNSILDLSSKIAKLLIREGVVLRPRPGRTLADLINVKRSSR